MTTHRTQKKTWSYYGIEVPETATGEFATTCPVCSEGRKKKNVRCFSVNIQKQVGQCHHCGETINLNQNSNNRDNNPKKRTKKPQLDNAGKLPAKVLEWFGERGISEHVLIRNKIGYGKIFMPQVEKEIDAIQFPYFRDGDVVNIKYRDANKNFRQVKDAEKILYKIDDIEDKSEIIITEGEIDALSFEEAGFVNGVSVPDGAPPPKSNNFSNKFDYLEPVFEIFSNAQKVIIATDNDAAGIQLSDELARRIGREKCWTVIYPEGCKDANDVLVKFGKEELKKVWTK